MYDRKIRFVTQVKTKNSHGEESVVLTYSADAWATVNFKGGREGFYARQVVATGDIVFKLRYQSGIDETMLISYNGKLYDIKHIAEEGRMFELHITATFADNRKLNTVVEPTPIGH